MHASLEMLEYLGSLGLYDINPYQKDLGGNTPRDWILDAYDGLCCGARTPSTAELCAFLNLCQGVKDRSLQHDINNIEQVVAGIQSRDAATAKHLGSLLTKEESWKREDLVCWYRAVDKRIQNLEWDLATEDLSEYLTDLKEELGTPVYDIPSEYGCPFSSSQIWEITASVSEELE
ncbi:ankyrin repeat, ph and sec7 domain containing protein secg [Fusarium flagelliforme]|nr:ankyrin repeat, ph and sec7 domain containing protein secg [Fusarium flagelliforme]